MTSTPKGLSKRTRRPVPDLSAELAYRIIEEGNVDVLRADPSGVDVKEGPVMFAVDQAGRHLLIPVTSEEEVPVDLSGRGVQIRARPIGKTAEAARSHIDVVCMAPQLNGVFATFVEDLLRELEPRPSDARVVVPDVLHRWRELLRPVPRSDFTEEKLVGLIAELQLLVELCGIDSGAALDSWRGWEGEKWDFISGNQAVEVKGTTESDARGFWIHGLDQLDTSDGTNLVLHFRRYIPDDDGGTGVSDLLSELADIGVDDAAVRARIARLGWLPPADGAQARYSLVEQVSWSVDETFPRIVPASFTNETTLGRISHLTYWLDLSQPPPVPMTSGAFDTHLRGLVGA